MCLVTLCLLGCGTKVIDLRTHHNNQPIVEDSWIIRGTMEMKLDSHSRLLFLSSSPQEFPQPVSGSVAEFVKFSVSNANFIIPNALVNITPYGSLDVTNIYDNRLRVCGTTGKDKCKTAMLRIFTKGAGAGFWNAVDGYGAPILTTGNVVGLDVGGAYIVKTVTIPLLKFIVKFSDFSSNGQPLPIPIAIDFTDAPYGDYATTIIIQYALK